MPNCRGGGGGRGRGGGVEYNVSGGELERFLKIVGGGLFLGQSLVIIKSTFHFLVFSQKVEI